MLQGPAGAGADLIELGFPFSDPMAEGPPIQRAAQRGLKSGMTLKGTLDLVAAFREGDQDTPIILMGYLNPLVTLGLRDLRARRRQGRGRRPDHRRLPAGGGRSAGPTRWRPHGLALIRLATPTTDDARLPTVVRRTSGFVYYVSVAGVTGVKSADAADCGSGRGARAGGLGPAGGRGLSASSTPEQRRRGRAGGGRGRRRLGPGGRNRRCGPGIERRRDRKGSFNKAQPLAKAVRSARVGTQ